MADNVMAEFETEFPRPVETIAYCDYCGKESGQSIDPEANRNICDACRPTWVSDVVDLLVWSVEAEIAHVPGEVHKVYKQIQRLPRVVLQDLAELAIGELSALLHQLTADAVAAADDRYEWDDSHHFRLRPARGGLAWWVAREKEIAEFARRRAEDH